MRSVANLISQNYGSIYTTSGGGKKQIGGVNVTSFLRNILGNRVLDLYLKYAGIKTLTTSTLVPFALILGKEYVERLMNSQTGGSVLSKKLPIFDHELVGNYLKLVGLSTLKLTPNTLLPLGVLMIIHDLYMNYTQTGGVRKNKQKGGSRLPLNNSIPPSNLQNLDNFLRGVSFPAKSGNPLVNNHMQQACLTGDCGTLTQNSSSVFSKPSIDIMGFPDQAIPGGKVEQSSWAGYSGENLNTNAKYADIYNIPNSMAGGSRELQPNELRGTPKNIESLSVSQYGGNTNMTNLYNNLEKNMNLDRVKIVSELIGKWQKFDRQSIPGELSRHIRKISKDNRYSNKNILKLFPKSVLLQAFN